MNERFGDLSFETTLVLEHDTFFSRVSILLARIMLVQCETVVAPGPLARQFAAPQSLGQARADLRRNLGLQIGRQVLECISSQQFFRQVFVGDH